MTMSRARAIDDTQAAELVERFRGGESVPELAQSYFVSADTIDRYLHKAIGNRRGMRVQQRNVIVRQMREQGMTFEQIGTALDVSPSTVYLGYYRELKKCQNKQS